MVAPYLADEVSPVVSPALATLQLVDHPAEDGIAPEFEKLSTHPTSELAGELDGAAEWLGVDIEEILLAALGSALGRTRGEGALAVDVTVEGSPWFKNVSVMCSGAHPMGPTEMLQGAHTALGGATGSAGAPSEVLLNLTSDRSVAGGSHLLELRVCRTGEQLQLDWLYDATRFDPYSIEELAEQFPFALIELTSDAAAPL